MPRTSIERLAAAFARAVEEVGGRCAFVGAMAVSVWGVPRSTSDIDVLVILAPERFARFVTALRRRRLDTTLYDLTDGLSQRSHVTVRDTRSTDHWIDLKFALSAEEREEVLRAARVGPDRLPIAAAEETIAYKIKFGSDQDLRDARGILLARRELDRARILALARHLRVERQWRSLERSVASERGRP